LYLNKKYEFYRTDGTQSHPFYISDAGINVAPSGNINLTGDGDVGTNNGIKYPNSFILDFTGLTDSDTLYYFCTNHPDMMNGTFILANGSPDAPSGPGAGDGVSDNTNQGGTGDNADTSPNDPTSATTNGDPYVTPIYGLQYKLPDREACYRLFERGDVFINGLVKEASKQKQQKIRDYAEAVHAKFSKTLGVAEALKMLSLDNVLLNGYFFDSFFIYSEGHAVFVDLQNKEFKSKENTQDYFTIKQQEHKSTNNGSSNNLFQESKYTKVTVNWRHSKFGKMNSFVSFYDNPQIDNGMTITKSMTTKDCVGLLMYNYKPKLMEIPTLTTLTHKKLHKRLKNAKNKFVNKNIILKKEEWKSIAAKTVKTIENKDIKKC